MTSSSSLPDSPVAAPSLPPPRTPGRYLVGLVCLGNICRSPIADVVLSEKVAEAGLDEQGVVVSSGGTGGWHIGDPMDDRAAAVLRGAGLDPSAHRASQVDPGWLVEQDLVLVMDAQNLADVRELLDTGDHDHDDRDDDRDDDRVRLFGAHDPVDPGAEVPDPYYGGPHGFEQVLAMVERTANALVTALAAPLATPPTGPR